MRYDLLLPLLSNASIYERVFPAMIVDVASHLTNATFAVHHDPSYEMWCVSNIETGASVAKFARTDHEAIERARARLAQKTEADIESAYLKIGTVVHACGQGANHEAMANG